MAEAVSRVLPPRRNISKPGVTLSEEQQLLENADAKFLTSIREGNKAAVQEALANGQFANVGTDLEESAVQVATRLNADGTATWDGQHEILKILIANNACVDYPDVRLPAPFAFCLDKLSMLTLADCVRSQSYDMRPIHSAIQGQVEAIPLVRTLLDAKETVDGVARPVVDFGAIDKQGNNLIQFAAWNGNEEAARLLLERGTFDLEAKNRQGQTALHLASFRAGEGFVKMLVEAGADPNSKVTNSRRISKETPLMMATSMGKDATAKYLADLSVTLDAVKFASKMKRGASKNEAGAVAA